MEKQVSERDGETEMEGLESKCATTDKSSGPRSYGPFVDRWIELSDEDRYLYSGVIAMVIAVLIGCMLASGV